MRLAETSRRSGRTVHVFATPKTARSSLPAHFWVPVSRSSRQMIVRGVLEPPISYPRQTLTLSPSPRTLFRGTQRAACSRRKAHPAKHLPPSSMVEQSALNRSIGVRIPGGQPVRVPASPITSPRPPQKCCISYSIRLAPLHLRPITSHNSPTIWG